MWIFTRGDILKVVVRKGVKDMTMDYIPSFLGTLTVREEEGCLVSIDFGRVDIPGLQEVRTPLTKRFLEEMDAYERGELQSFSVPLAPQGTAFQQKVWQVLQDIPYGETWSYEEVAKAVGNDKAARAVGMANNKNPLPIVIPCHRVIGKNGQLVGYGGGLDIKIKLLKLEGILL